MVDLNKDVKYIKNVGPNRVTLLNKLKIYTLEDLITYFPRNHEDRSVPKKIRDAVEGEEVLIKAKVCTAITEIKTRKMTMYKTMVSDGEDVCTITWYNQKYIKDVIKMGRIYNFYGKIENKLGRYEMKSPVFDEQGVDKNTGKIIPIYSSTFKLPQNTIRKIMENGIKEVYGKLEETLPEYIMKQYNLVGINEAIKNIHFPQSNQDFQRARDRLVFEELLVLQLA